MSALEDECVVVVEMVLMLCECLDVSVGFDVVVFVGGEMLFLLLLIGKLDVFELF